MGPSLLRYLIIRGEEAGRLVTGGQAPGRLCREVNRRRRGGSRRTLQHGCRLHLVGGLIKLCCMLQRFDGHWGARGPSGPAAVRG